MILPRSVVQELTGYTRASAQVRWLRKHGWRFVINAKGRVIVALAERNRKIGPPLQEPLPAILAIDDLRKLSRDIPVRQGGGVYFLWCGDELLYIGQTMRFGQRIGDHEYQARIPFEWSTFIVCPDQGARVELEEAYIRLYRPPYNRK
jgi:hypothetical protein